MKWFKRFLLTLDSNYRRNYKMVSSLCLHHNSEIRNRHDDCCTIPSKRKRESVYKHYFLFLFFEKIAQIYFLHKRENMGEYYITNRKIIQLLLRILLPPQMVCASIWLDFIKMLIRMFFHSPLHSGKRTILI